MLPIWMPMEMVRPVNISLTTKDLVVSHISTAELKQLISVPFSCIGGRDHFVDLYKMVVRQGQAFSTRRR